MGSNCPLTGCMDDLCRGSRTCLIDGSPLAERCLCCGEENIPEFGLDCACERNECEHCEPYDYDYEDDC